MDKAHILSIAVTILTLSFNSYSIDIVKLHRQDMSDKKVAHNIAVVRRSLEVTELEYGAFQLDLVNVEMSVNRKLISTKNGEIINAVIIPASQDWDRYNIPIKVPVRLGLLSYRLLLINKADLPKFERITTIEQLNVFLAGLVDGWITTEVYKFNKMKFLETGHFEGLFLMLAKNRFDYIPRGIYEIYDELSSRQPLLQDIVVEPTLALYIPTSSYVYVSPSEPRIAKRIELGLNKLLTSSELKTILYQYYAQEIKRAKLAERKIFKIKKPYHNKSDIHLFHAN